MTENELSSKFNERRTLVSQMDQKQQQRLEKLKQTRLSEETRIQDRQNQEREQNIKMQEDALTKKAEFNMSAPRPKNAPTPTMPTRAEIESEARSLNQQAETKELQDHSHSFDLVEKRLIEKALQRQVEYQKPAPERT